MSSSLGSNILKILTSRVATQSILFLTAPITTRLFAPEDYGIRQLFASITGIIATIICLRYELSIPLGKNEREVVSSLTLSIMIAFFFSLFVLAILPFTKEFMFNFSKLSGINNIIWLIPLCLFLSGLGGALRYWVAYEGSFSLLAWSDFSSALIGKSATILWALVIGASATGLIAGDLIGGIISILFFLFLLGSRIIFNKKFSMIKLDLVLSTAKKYKKFPIYDSWTALINSTSHQLSPILLGIFFSPIIVGHYSLGLAFISIPLTLLGNSIGQVFFPTAAKEFNQKGNMSEIVRNVYQKLVQIGVFPMLILGLFGSYIFTFIFGQKWHEAGIFTQILSIFMMFRFIASPLSTVFTIKQRQDILLIWNILFVIITSVSIIIGASTANPRTCLFIYGISGIISYLPLLHIIIRNCQLSVIWSLKLFLKYFALSCLLLLPIVLLAQVFRNTYFILIGVILVSLIYIGCLYKFDPAIHSSLKMVLNKKIFSKNLNGKKNTAMVQDAVL